ncbi:hypothetical protein ES319_D11G084300v1 [Gossypium barbadense]|uniref:Uncharacterized protein n=1 Tax=Gossypium barbadense TaxID=3634 RepID=A0A5J5PAM4_GOSBA|nr:hypothetical protein ES319_D11G084300v1 [Gossypium barbadense]
MIVITTRSFLGKAGCFNVKNGSFDNPYEENVVQAWSSKYVQGEPTVVLAQPHCGVEKYGELISFRDDKPLGLPVRSLKSRAMSPEFGNGWSDSSGPSVMDSSDGSDKSENGSFSDLTRENLEGKSNKSGALGSPMPWSWRSGRVRQRFDGGSVTRPFHFRPLSVDESQFQSLKSRSLHSQLASQSHSPSSLSPSHPSSSEPPKSKMIESLKERNPSQSFPLPSPLKRRKPVIASHSRQYSDGSLLGTRSRKCFEDEWEEFCDSKKDDGSSTNKERVSRYPLKFDAKPIAPSKASSRGKSVRTFRGSGITIVGSGDAREKQENHTKGCDEIEEVEGYKGGSDPKLGDCNPSVVFNRQNLGGNAYMPNPTYSRNRNQEFAENSESEREDEDFGERSDEATMSGTTSVAGSDTYEVDRKAGEFIAKFREQIRLQRTTSIDTLKGFNVNFLE